MAGFAIFSMFFGSGNIVFPLVLGRLAGDAWFFSMLGFFLTAVLVPLLGLMTVVLLQGNSLRFFNIIGTVPGRIVQLFIIALLGPFSVIPRCISVGYGALSATSTFVPLIVFSAFFCVAIWFLTIRRERVIPVIGKILTPIKLGLLTLLIIFGIYWAPPLPATVCNSLEVFTRGARDGYQTMDLAAAIFFSAAIMAFFQTAEDNDRKSLLKNGLQASVIGAALMTIVYAGFMYLGSAYAGLACSAKPEEILPTIANHALGTYGGLALSSTVIFSCLTTSVALITCWIDTLKSFASIQKLPHTVILAVSLIISFALSTLGFSGISRFLGPILTFIYPVLIVMAIVHVVREMLKLKNDGS